MTMKQLVDIFGRDKTTWSRCFWWVVKFIFDTHKQLLSDFSRTVVDRLPMYSKAIAREANKAKNLPPVNDFDEDDFSPALMIDCNLMKTCRAGSGPATPGPGAARRDPRGDIQRSVYNGWARAHGGKFETAGAPDGMTVFIFGLVSLRHNDAFVLTLSKILVLLKAAQQHLPAHMQRVLYGDSAYPWMEHLRSRHNADAAHPRKAELDDEDKAMASVREYIEWEYGEEDQFFPFSKAKERLKLNSSMPLMELYFCRVLLRNCYNCLYHGKTSLRFGVAPPSLEDYINTW